MGCGPTGFGAQHEASVCLFDDPYRVLCHAASWPVSFCAGIYQEFARFLANLHWALRLLNEIWRVHFGVHRPKCIESLTQATGFNLSECGFLGDTHVGLFFMDTLMVEGCDVIHTNNAALTRTFALRNLCILHQRTYNDTADGSRQDQGR